MLFIPWFVGKYSLSSHCLYVLPSETISANVQGSDWILGNVMQYGYYRVTYSDDNWNKLINQLDEDHKVKDEFSKLIKTKFIF